MPAFKTIKDRKYRDKRGFTEEKLGRSYFDRIRAIKQVDPKEYVTYCAEFCYNGEEAFSLEGENKFNKINIANNGGYLNESSVRNNKKRNSNL